MPCWSVCVRLYPSCPAAFSTAALHGISRLPKSEETAGKRGRFAETTIGYVHIDVYELRCGEGKVHMSLGIDRVSKFTYVEPHPSATMLTGAELDFSRPGTPTDNAFIEAFNARIRAECLNASWFLSLADARDRIEAWRIDYNTERPHFGLGPLDARGLHPPS
jgi:hypothetical protein